MPVVKLRRSHHPAQAAEVETDIRVNEGGLDTDECDVGDERRLTETEHIDRYVGQSACHRHIDQVQPRTSQPVHHVG